MDIEARRIRFREEEPAAAAEVHTEEQPSGFRGGDLAEIGVFEWSSEAPPFAWMNPRERTAFQHATKVEVRLFAAPGGEGGPPRFSV